MGCGSPTRCSDAVIIHLSHCCKLLEEVYFGSCDALTDASLFALAAHCHALTRVDVSGCNLLTDAGICVLATLPRLSSANALGSMQLTDVSGEALLSMPLSCCVSMKWCNVSPTMEEWLQVRYRQQ